MPNGGDPSTLDEVVGRGAFSTPARGSKHKVAEWLKHGNDTISRVH
jgi:hypothetical protein